MRKVRVPVNSFQFGEVSDSLVMRTDTPVYPQSAQRVENMLITPEGSLKKRPGLKHIYDYSITANGNAQSHLFKFVFDENEEYIVSLEDAKIRVFRLLTDGTVSLVSTLTTDVDGDPLPFDETYLQQYTTAQYGDVMFICHPLIAPRVLVRTGLTSFEVSTFTFDQRADGSVTYQPYTQFRAQGVTLDPSATSGTGITLTTSADYWVADHVGSIIRYGTSEIIITSVTSATVAVGDVISELKIRLEVLNPFRTIDGSSTVEVTHINHGFSGGETIVFEEASAVGGINAGNLNGTRTVTGIIDEDTYTFTAGGAASSAEDGGGYVKVVTHAPTTQWDEQSFSAVRGYPAAVVFHQNRLCFGGTLAEPDGIWMSRIGEFFDFYVTEGKDDEAISLTAATGDVNEIRYMISNRDLQIFTASGELYVPTYLNQAITPTNVQIRKQTPFGAEHVQPVSIDGATVFVQIGGKIVREYLFTDDEDAYTSTAISTISSQLINAPRCMTVSHSGFDLPDSFAVLTMSNGEGAAFTSNRAERRAGWMRLTTTGSFCSVVAVKDRIFANVYDEYDKLQLCEFDGDVGLDLYLYKAISGTTVDVSDLYSEDQVVDVIATDGSTQSYIGQFTVDAGGLIDITAYSGLGLTHVYVGKAFTAKIITNPFDASISNGPRTGEIRGITNVVIDMKNTLSMTVNNRPLVTDSLFTGKKEFRTLGYNRDPKVTIAQNDPLPMQVNGIVAELIY